MAQLTLVETFLLLNNVWHIRLKKHESLDLDKTFTLFQGYSMVLVSHEGGSGTKKDYHQHVLLVSNSKEELKYTNDTIRLKSWTILRALIATVYPDLKGNKHVSIAPARNEKSLASYVVKDGEYAYKGFTKEFIDKAIQLSYNNDLSKKKFVVLKELVLTGGINLHEYSRRVLILKGDMLQPIYCSHHVAHVRSVGVKTKSIDVDTLNDKLMERVHGYDNNF